MRQISIFCPHSKSYIYLPLPRFPCLLDFLVSNIPNIISSKSLNIQYQPLAIAHVIYISGHLSFQTEWASRFTAWSSPQWKYFISLLSIRTHLSWAIIMQQFTLICGNVSQRIMCKLGLKFFLLSPLIRGSTPQGHRCEVKERQQCSRSRYHESLNFNSCKLHIQ